MKTWFLGSFALLTLLCGHLAAQAPAPVVITLPPGAPVAAPAQAPAATPAPANPEQVNVQAMLRAFTAAYNEAKIDALRDLFVENAKLSDPDGSATRGRDEILKNYEEGFSDGAPYPIQGKPEAYRFLTPDVVEVEGTYVIGDTESGEAPVQTGRYEILATRTGGAWKIAEIRDFADEVPDTGTNYDRLAELEWMVGEWIDQNDNVRVDTTIEWAENQNFLVRGYTAKVGEEPVSSGTQWIGYDPQAGQIKSWSFDSNGGFGEALWTRSGENQWVLRSRGTLRDGRTTSVTQVITRDGADSALIEIVDRLVGGEEVDTTIDQVHLVRKPPEPGSGDAAPAAPAAPTAPGTVPAAPAAPAVPVAPAVPTAPAVPVAPAAPGTVPAAPAAPAVPVTPAAPVPVLVVPGRS
jgi:uncharacterized protein (TIGR02246 family)